MTLHDRQGQPVALIAVGRPRPDAPLKIAIQVPANTKVNHAMRLGTDSVDELVLPFTRCNQGGCLAEFDFYDDGVLRLLRAHPAGRPGRIAWQDFAGAPVVMEFPMRGFAALVDALRRDPR
jgi:invasion protein IalB